MARRFPLPAEGRLEAMIAEAWDRLPGPEAARVTRIAERIAHGRPARRPVNRLPWWIVILALSGAAAATWYAGGIWRRDAGTVAVPAAPPEPAPVQRETDDDSKGGRIQNDPRGLIYKREIP